MARRTHGPTVQCTDCPRTVKAAPGAETILRHNHPDGGKCPGSGRQVDLYSTGEQS